MIIVILKNSVNADAKPGVRLVSALLVMGKAYDAVLKYYIERPDDRLGLKGISSPSESLELRRQVL